MISLSNNIKTLRQEKQLSIRSLGKEIGVEYSRISRWETGKSIPNAEDIIKLAKFFNVSADYLLGLDMID